MTAYRDKVANAVKLPAIQMDGSEGLNHKYRTEEDRSKYNLNAGFQF